MTIPPKPSYPPNHPLSQHLKQLQKTYDTLLDDHGELIKAMQAFAHGVLTHDEYEVLMTRDVERREERMAAMREFKEIVLHQRGREWHECQFGAGRERIWIDDDDNAGDGGQAAREGEGEGDSAEYRDEKGPPKKKIRHVPEKQGEDSGWVSLGGGMSVYRGNNSKSGPAT
jgi:hypothetical protein